jgi:hypothetical protein
MDFKDFQSIYDFTLIERAVQSLFVAAGADFVAPLDDNDAAREQWAAGVGNIAFYSAFQALTFTQCRPRVFIGLHAINPVPGCYALDANGNLREKSWRGQIRFGIITEPNYTTHTALRARVLAIIPQVLGKIAADNSTFATTGINALLTYHQVSEFYAKDISTSVTPADGNYQSAITVELAFGVPPSAWPAGMQSV